MANRVVKQELDAFPNESLKELPEFNEHGVLPPEDYFPSRIDFEIRFVNYGDAVVRKRIYEGWNRHREQLVSDGLAKSARQLVNGSFTTSKHAPNDIDIVVEVPINDDVLERLKEPSAATSAIVRLLQGPKMKEQYQCDAYPIYCLSIAHKDYEAITLKAIRYWTKWFGQTRQGIPKGRIWTTVGD